MTRIVVATRFAGRIGEDIARALPGDDIVILDQGSLEGAGGAEVVLGSNRPDRVRALLAAAPTVRWYHSVAAGVDRIVSELAGRDGLILTNNSGSYDVPIAEHVIATIFAAAKHLPRQLAAQSRREWGGDPPNRELRGATIVILGMGSIGGEVARLATAIGMRVIGVTRHGRQGSVGPERLAEVAAAADYLAVCAPLTRETDGIVGAAVIARLPAHAWVINIARGAIVDEAALLAACREGRIGGAAIDAWWQEPLPKDSEWWSLPNVIVTPHTSNSSPRLRERTVALFLENLRRYKAGEPLLNVVDLGAGY